MVGSLMPRSLYWLLVKLKESFLIAGDDSIEVVPINTNF
jgi:hypothetical protein